MDVEASYQCGVYAGILSNRRALNKVRHERSCRGMSQMGGRNLASQDIRRIVEPGGSLLYCALACLAHAAASVSTGRYDATVVVGAASNPFPGGIRKSSRRLPGSGPLILAPKQKGVRGVFLMRPELVSPPSTTLKHYGVAAVSALPA